jgi:hypothetical protein
LRTVFTTGALFAAVDAFVINVNAVQKLPVLFGFAPPGCEGSSVTTLVVLR